MEISSLNMISRRTSSLESIAMKMTLLTKRNIDFIASSLGKTQQDAYDKNVSSDPTGKLSSVESFHGLLI